MLGKAFGPAMPDWNLKEKLEMMAKSSGGLPSERPTLFKGLLHLLDQGHHRLIAKTCLALQLQLCNKCNAKENREQIKGNQRSLWDRMKSIEACWYIVFKQLEQIS